MADSKYTKKGMSVGDEYWDLTILELLPGRKARCLCKCGQETTVFRNNLPRGNTTSCGCMKYVITAKKLTKHGMTGSPEHRTYIMMKNRCLNPHARNYAHYGGRGITICDQWQQSFATFFADMGPRPPHTTLDRINNAGNYEPGNCRWADQQTQMCNTRVSWSLDKILTAMAQWACKYGRAPRRRDFCHNTSLPSHSTVTKYFGSLANAREAIGWPRGCEGIGGNRYS